MSKEWEYLANNNWVICDICGFKTRAADIRRRWDNKWVCPSDFELRQPQDFVRARIDKIVADIKRPPPAETFIVACSATGRQGVAGVGTAGCAICELDLGVR